MSCGGVAHAATADTLVKPLAGNSFDVFVGDQIMYDDNLFRLPNGTTNVTALIGPNAVLQDHINTASAGADAQWEHSAQAVGLDLLVDENRFDRNSDLNNTSGRGKGVWDWIIGPHWLVEGGGDFSRNLANFANNKYFGRDLIDQGEYFANAQLQLGAHWAIAGGFREGHLTHSAQSLALLDAHTKTLTLGLNYLATGDDKFGWEYDRVEGTFPAEIQLNGLPFNRNFHDDKTIFLAHYAFSGRTSTVATFGYLKRNYETAEVGAFSGPIWSVTLNWQALEKIKAVLASSRQLTANIEQDSNYFVLIGGSASLVWQPRTKVLVSLVASRFEQNFIGSNLLENPGPLRRDTITDEQAVIEYTPRRYVDLKLSYGVEQRESNQRVFQYDDKLAKAGITFTF
jgi:hypothetical protein